MKQLFLTTIFLLCTITAIAQDGPPESHDAPTPQQFEKIKALKTAHITNALELTSKQAEKFWPVYNTSQEKIKALHKKSRKFHKKAMENFEKLTESDAQKIVNESISLEHQLQNEKEKMLKNVMRTLSAKKAIQLQKAEHEFKRKLLRKMKGKKRGEKEARKGRGSNHR